MTGMRSEHAEAGRLQYMSCMMTETQAPILAGKAGSYRETRPVAPLQDHFSRAWVNRMDGSHPMHVTVVPDGCTDILWKNGRLVVVGPDITAATPVLMPGQPVVGLRFRDGAARAWLGVPLDEIVGAEVAMTEFWGSEAQRIADELAASLSVHDQLSTLQGLMSARAARLATPPGQARVIVDLLKARCENKWRDLSPLLDILNTSERSLRRWSYERFGYGVKTLDRILRFQRFQQSAGSARQSSLAVLAAEAGYADQAHMSREVRALTGMTAAAFVRQLG